MFISPIAEEKPFWSKLRSVHLKSTKQRQDISMDEKADYGFISLKHQLNPKGTPPQQYEVSSSWHKLINLTSASLLRDKQLSWKAAQFTPSYWGLKGEWRRHKYLPAPYLLLHSQRALLMPPGRRSQSRASPRPCWKMKDKLGWGLVSFNLLEKKNKKRGAFRRGGGAFPRARPA